MTTLQEIEETLIGYNDRGIVDYWEDRKYAKCCNCGEEVRGSKAKDWIFGHKGCKKPNGYFVRNDITVEKIRTALIQMVESEMEAVKKLKQEYKNNEDYAEYGTLEQNICHDDGYMAAIDDVRSHLQTLISSLKK